MTNIVKIVPPEPLLRADAMAYVRFARRDPDTMEKFLKDFGFTRCATQGDTRYYRGHGTAAWLVSVTPANSDRFIGFGFAAKTAQDLETLSKATRRPPDAIDAPGGGKRVRLIDPNGIEVDLVDGITPSEPLPTRDRLLPFNTPGRKQRINQTVRPPLEPSPIFRLGHVVLQQPDFDGTVQWYMRHFGLIASDVQYAVDGRPALAFCRLNRGDEPADHHSVALAAGPKAGLLHVSFETFDLESVGQGQQYLLSGGWKHVWGIGRHNLGSQIFDYWQDPGGAEWEHYADGDVMDASVPTAYSKFTRGSLWVWGDDLPDALRPRFSLPLIVSMLLAAWRGKLDMSRMKGVRDAAMVKPRPWLS